MPGHKGKTRAKTDILIPVMGATGAGKSFFVNTLLKDHKMKVGSDLKSCTRELGFGYMDTIEGYPALKDYRIVLVDTPGFDDTYETDVAILERIANWLKESYKKGAKLGGVIYLHDISAARFSGTARRNLQMFRSLCGEDVLDNVVLGTTKWVLNIPDSDMRHRELESNYWKSLIEKGARTRRFKDNSFKSAWSLIDALLSNRLQKFLEQTVLQIQKELVDKKIIIPETKAGQELRYTLQEVLDRYKELQKMKPNGDERLQAQLQEAQEKVQVLGSQIKKLKIPLSRRLRKIFAF